MKINIAVLSVVLLCAPLLEAKLPQKTKITGNRMEIIRGGETLVFSEGARVTKESDLLEADRIVQDKNNNIVEASGNVHLKSLSQDNEPVEAFSGRARYFLEKDYGELWENRPLIKYYRKDEENPFTICADRIVMDKPNGITHASGSAELVTTSGTAKSDTMIYLQKEKTLELKGEAKPYFIYTAKGHYDRFEGDNMIYYMDKKLLRITGHVKGRVKDMNSFKK